MNIFLLGATPKIIALPGEDPLSKLSKTGGNTGNQLIAHGLLERIAYDKIAWDYSIDPREVHERFDMILIAAANFLFPKFDFGGMAEYIERCDLPVSIVGLGAQSNNYDANIDLLPGTERFVKVIAERTVSIGVRGPYTQEVLARRGIDNVTVTGCPSYYMAGPRGFNLKRRPFQEIRHLAVNASRDVISHSFDSGRMRCLVQKIYRTGMLWDADFIAQSEPAEIKLADRPSEGGAGEPLREIASFMEAAAGDRELRNWATNHVRVFFDVEQWLEAMTAYDFVFGNRFHGCMIALQRNVPSVVICHDTRTEDMCRFLGLPFASILDLDEIDVRLLYERIDFDGVARRYRELHEDYVQFLTANGLIPRGYGCKKAASTAGNQPVELSECAGR